MSLGLSLGLPRELGGSAVAVEASAYVTSVVELDIFLSAYPITIPEFDVVWPAMGFVDLAAVDTALETPPGILKQDIIDEYNIQFP